MRKLIVCLLLFGLSGAPASADDTVSFQGKTVSAVIGFPPGGGTDILGRAFLPYLEKYLPGNPTVVPKNVPGADGVTAMNFLAQQAPADGTTISISANTTADPLNFRKPQVHYLPSDFEVIGGGGRGGEVLVIHKDAEKRLSDKAAPPVVMGTLGGIPRSGMQMAAWGIELLGWNAKWVGGYPGTNQLALALERGEIDMTATGNIYVVQKLLDTGKFKILVQSGMLKSGSIVSREDFGNAPLLGQLVESKLDKPELRKAFEYWTAIIQTDKWVALPPKTPKAIVETYRAAFEKLSRDAEFLERARKTSDDFVPLDAAAVEKLIRTLSSLPPETTEFMKVLLKKQGLAVD